MPRLTPHQLMDDLDTTLDADEFRLFYLYPENWISHLRGLFSRSQNHQRPRGFVRKFKIDNAPPFRAVSYTCGDPYLSWHWNNDQLVFDEDQEPVPEHDAQVVVNKKRFAIYWNLLQALQMFSSKGICGWMWIDVICINQVDNVERAKQINLMSKIFASAEEVLVWLGYETPQTELAFQLVHDLPKAVREVKSAGIVIDPYTMNDDRLTGSDFAGKLGIKDMFTKLLDLAMFCETCRYFARVWTMQEILLSKKARLFCGRFVCNWGVWKEFMAASIDIELSRAIGLAVEEDWKIQRPWLLGLCRIWDQENLEMLALNEIPTIMIPMLHAQNLADLPSIYCMYHLAASMMGIRSAGCFDGRDKVYGILGIVESRSKATLESILQVDYESAVETVYEKIFTKILQTTLSLDLLSNATAPIADLDARYPTWVPDYRQDFRSVPLYTSRQHGTNAFRASIPLSLLSEVRISEHKLQCTGIRLDEVYIINSGDLRNPDFHQQVLRFALQLPTMVNGRRRLEVLWRTIVADTPLPSDVGVSTRSPNQCEMSFVMNYLLEGMASTFAQDQDPAVLDGRLTEVLHLLHCFELSDEPGCRYDEDMIRNHFLSPYNRETSSASERAQWDALSEILHPFNIMRARFATGRQLFISQQRALLGLGTDNVAEGDEIWILCNASTPYVLRPTAQPGEYRLVGDCFILDHMHGEVFAKEPELSDQVKEIYIV